MPLYEYACRTCATRFELMRKVDERMTPATCPSCDTGDASFVLSAPAKVGVGAAAEPARTCAADPGSCCGGACMN